MISGGLAPLTLKGRDCESGETVGLESCAPLKRVYAGVQAVVRLIKERGLSYVQASQDLGV